MTPSLFWIAVIIIGSVAFGVFAEALIAAIRHRNEHYEQNDYGSRQ